MSDKPQGDNTNIKPLVEESKYSDEKHSDEKHSDEKSKDNEEVDVGDLNDVDILVDTIERVVEDKEQVETLRKRVLASDYKVGAVLLDMDIFKEKEYLTALVKVFVRNSVKITNNERFVEVIKYLMSTYTFSKTVVNCFNDALKAISVDEGQEFEYDMSQPAKIFVWGKREQPQSDALLHAVMYYLYDVLDFGFDNKQLVAMVKQQISLNEKFLDIENIEDD